MENELLEALRKLSGADLPVFVGTVKSVDKEKGICSVLYDTYSNEDFVIDNVRLSAVINERKEKFWLYPKIGSSVLVGSIDEDIKQLFITQYSDLEEIMLLDGSFGGLVKVEELTKKLNRLEEKVNNLIIKYNTHTHITTATISATPIPGIIAPPVAVEQPIMPLTKRNELENEKVKHGE